MQPDASQSGKAMEESFVVLPPAAASMYEPASDGGGTHISCLGGSPISPLHTNNTGFYSRITVLQRAFEIATTQTQVRLSLGSIHKQFQSHP